MSRARIAMIFDRTLRPDTTGGYCLRAMSSLAKAVHFQPEDVERIEPGDFDLFINIDDGLRYRLPDHLYPSAWWAIDTHLDFDWYREKAPDFDLVFTAQRDGATRLAESLKRQVHWLPLACDPAVHRRHPVEKKWNACFIGNIFPGLRSELVNKLSSAFNDVLIDRRFFDDMAKAFSESRIIFNQSIRNDINMRVFEALACGSMLLTNDLSNNGLSELFELGEHLETFRSEEELIDKVRFYLKNESAREQIAASGRDHVLQKHTYRQRMETILTVAHAELDLLSGIAEKSKLSFRPKESSAELTSIVLVTWNQLEFTRQCIDSIHENTEQEYELIVVDNGSTDGTAEYLEDCRDVLLVRNFENKGFPAAANQGIRLSRGQRVILLNNDTIVPRDWLGPLLDPFKRDARIGLVGPSSNCVSGLQQIEARYRDRNEFNKFAQDLRIKENHTLQDVDRLIGFCMAINRKVIDRIGLLDESFGIGCFEDDDYTLRAIEAGFRTVIARDAFIHHFGSRSFLTLGDQFDSILRNNQAKFLQKWSGRQPERLIDIPGAPFQNGAQNRILLLVDLECCKQLRRYDLLGRYRALMEQDHVIGYGPGIEGYRGNIPIDDVIKTVSDGINPSWILHAAILDGTTELLVPGLERCRIPKAIDLDNAFELEHVTTLLERNSFRTVFTPHSGHIDSLANSFPRVHFYVLPGNTVKLDPTCLTSARSIDLLIEQSTGSEDVSELTRHKVGIVDEKFAALNVKELGSEKIFGADVVASLGVRQLSPEVATAMTNCWIFVPAKRLESIKDFVAIASTGCAIAADCSPDIRAYFRDCFVDIASCQTVEEIRDVLVNALSNTGVLSAMIRKTTDTITQEFSPEFRATRMLEILSSIDSESTQDTCGIAVLEVLYPWPTERPVVKSAPPVEGWFADGARDALRHSLSNKTKIVVELGCWMGESTRFIADHAPNAKVIAIDHFEGSDEHRNDPRFQKSLPELFDAFIDRSWGYRHQIIPVRSSTRDGLRIFASYGIVPELIYIDASHDYESVLADIQLSWALFPDAVLVGDDFADPEVQRAVMEIASELRLDIVAFGRDWPAWRLVPQKRNGDLAKVDSNAAISAEARIDVIDRPLLSLCMIVRDNEGTIRPALESIKPWVDEMIVVDTGSKDRTPQICQELGAKVYYYPWCDDFSAARNESLKYANGEWLFWMDSDDTIPEECGKRLHALVRQKHEQHILGYVMQVHCPSGQRHDGSAVTVVDHVKLIRNDPKIRFEGRIHEQLMSAIRSQEGDVGWTDVYVNHSGSDHSPATRKRKLERDFHLLRLDCNERPKHPFVRFNLGMTYADAGMFSEAIAELEHCLQLSDPAESHVRKAYALLASAHVGAGNLEAATDVCEHGLSLFPDDCELRFRKAILLQEKNDLSGAEKIYRELLGCETGQYFVSLDSGLRGYKARHNLAIVLEQMGRYADAIEQWKIITQEEPSYPRGWRGLGESFVASGSIEEATALADGLMMITNSDELQAEGHLLHARVANWREYTQQAINSLMQSVTLCPQKDVLNIASHMAIQLGRADISLPWLERLTELEPSDAAAWHNFGTALCSTGEFREAIPAFQRSLGIRPNSLSTIVQATQAFRLLGEDDLAMKLCLEGMSMFPLSPELKAEMEYLQTEELSVSNSE